MSWLQELDFETADGIVRAWFVDHEAELMHLGIEAEVRSHPDWQLPTTLIELRANGYVGAVQFELSRDQFKFVVRKSRRATLVGHAMFQEEPEPAFIFALQLAAELITNDSLAILEG